MPWTKSNNEKVSRGKRGLTSLSRKVCKIERDDEMRKKQKAADCLIRRLLSVLSSVGPRSAGTAQKSGPNNRGGGGGKSVRRLLRTPDFRNVFRSCLPLSVSLFPSVFCPPAFVRPSLSVCLCLLVSEGVIRRTVRLFFARRTNRGVLCLQRAHGAENFFRKNAEEIFEREVPFGRGMPANKRKTAREVRRENG